MAANFFVIVMLLVAASDFGKIRIGGPDALPEFSTASWYAMLISAGMGIGLMFWSVAEPIFHYSTPSPMFDVPANSAQSAQVALGLTYYHWGIHPWGIYALVGLSLAFFAYNRGLPLTIRSIFHPLLGDRIYGFWGNLIDVLSVMATLFGLATSLGLGVKQVVSGLHYLFGFPTSTGFAVVLIGVITLLAVVSIATGLDKGGHSPEPPPPNKRQSLMEALHFYGPPLATRNFCLCDKALPYCLVRCFTVSGLYALSARHPMIRNPAASVAISVSIMDHLSSR